MGSLRLAHDNLYADIIQDTRGVSGVWMYVVQREGSPAVLALGSCTSREEAKAVSTRIMKQLQEASSSVSAS